MWPLMMVAMMLPSFVLTLCCYRQAVGKAGEMRLSWLTVLTRHRVLLRLDCVRNCCFPTGRGAWREPSGLSWSGRALDCKGATGLGQRAASFGMAPAVRVGTHMFLIAP
jgi:hypothetical protein